MIAGYRSGEIPVPTPSHVAKWVRQFPKGVQRPILREVEHALRETYISREIAIEFLNGLISTRELVGVDAAAFWRTVNFLDCQQYGTSQKDMLDLLGARLEAIHGVAIGECGSKSGPFVYLDDVIFTGGRAGEDLENWIRCEAPPKAALHVIVFALHRFGEYKVSERLREAAADADKEVEIKFWRFRTVENRLARKNNSEVLWPIELPDDAQVNAYASEETRFPWVPREPGGRLGPFSSEQGRQLLEREFLIAGVKIRLGHEDPSTSLRPLGFSPFGLGFGSMTVTFRNCPNNTPLALWWGNIDASGPANFNNWYPLFPRKTYQDPRGSRDAIWS